MERKETFIENILMASMILLFGIVLFVVLKGWIEGRFSSIASLRSYIQEFGLLGPFILTIIQVLQVVLPVLPGFFWMYCRGFYVWSNERVLDQLYRHLPGFFDGILVS